MFCESACHEESVFQNAFVKVFEINLILSWHCEILSMVQHRYIYCISPHVSASSFKNVPFKHFMPKGLFFFGISTRAFHRFALTEVCNFPEIKWKVYYFCREKESSKERWRESTKNYHIYKVDKLVVCFKVYSHFVRCLRVQYDLSLTECGIFTMKKKKKKTMPKHFCMRAYAPSFYAKEFAAQK